MSLFQKSVTNKYLKNLDTKKVDKAFENFRKFYGNKMRLANIMQLKEENYQEGFLREIFVETLGYIINPDENYNLTTEFKNQKDARKADGAILKNGKAIGVIELKSTKTKNLESIKEQAFGYKNNQPDCKYVITSNFQKLRFYIDNATEYEEFDLFKLNKQDFKLLYLLLSGESIFSDLPEKLKEETKFHENDISTKLYEDYKHFKDKIFENLLKNNPQYDKLTLFKKSQKLLDRFLFIFFAEDSGLIPPNAVSKIVEQWKVFIEEDEYFTLYSRFQKLFTHLDKGHIYKKWGEIPAYNGGLFRNDEILDSSEVKIDDEILEKDSLKLSTYDFSSEVDVNILGHIFEHSLNEIEEITAELHGEKLDKKKSKRKKDGVFYTPKYITKYIVENTVGTLCKEKKEELQINNLLINETYRKKDGKTNEKGKKLFKTLNGYKDWLLTLKILDPACGSGAFLNQTLDFLIAEHKQADDLIAELTGDGIRMFDTDKAILENNIYGVDINEESVEIAKLSLWLRTAQKGRPLSDLSGNIKCGNSLIDDPEVAGDKAFDWHKEFPHVFNPEIKEKNYQKLPEIKPDYVKLIKEKTKEAEKLAKEAVEISKKVYEYAEKIQQVNEPDVTYGIQTKGGFDVVLGNPPYGAKISKEEQKFLNNKYIKGGSETVISFLKLSESLLRNNGTLGFIIPKSFSYASNYKNIRTFLRSNVTQIVDCQKVWKEVKLEQVIVLFTKNKLSDFYNTSILENQEVKKVGKIKKNTFEKYGFFLNNVNNKELEISNKLTKDNLFLNDISTNSRGGIFQKHLTNDGDFEVLGGAEIQRYGIVGIKGKVKAEIVENEIKTSIIENSVLVQNIVAHIENPKPHIKITACLPDNFSYKIVDTINQIVVNANYSNKLIWIILNSKLINWYSYRFIFGKAIRTMHFDSPVTSKIPIKEIPKEAQQPFIEKANLMLSLNKELQTKAEKFIKRIKSNLEIKKITNKLNNFYNFDFKTFVSELKKQKVKLNFKDQDEWEDYFDSYKTEINKLQHQINQTDNEIDKMVYELYELTPEEIEIVENSVK